MKLILGGILIFGSIGAFELGSIHVLRFLIQECVGIYFMVNGVGKVYKVR